jgi:hypothetical protein
MALEGAKANLESALAELRGRVEAHGEELQAKVGRGRVGRGRAGACSGAAGWR